MSVERPSRLWPICVGPFAWNTFSLFSTFFSWLSLPSFLSCLPQTRDLQDVPVSWVGCPPAGPRGIIFHSSPCCTVSLWQLGLSHHPNFSKQTRSYLLFIKSPTSMWLIVHNWDPIKFTEWINEKIEGWLNCKLWLTSIKAISRYPVTSKAIATTQGPTWKLKIPKIAWPDRKSVV